LLAEDLPTQPVRIVVGFAPGGLNDINARLIGHWLSERLRQQFIIDNRPGASGNIAMESVVRSPPDGYTLVTVATSSAVNVTLFKNLPFNFLRDIAPVGSIRLFGRIQMAMPRWRCAGPAPALWEEGSSRWARLRNKRTNRP
jgi:tripartite-type tricarboxylate transporter receptor subunit TctC